ncbi:MAG: YkvA family protein [Bacteroidota bacterium]
MSNSDLITKVLGSIFFRKATGKAGKVAGNSFLILKLIRDALQKASASGGSKGMVDLILSKITLLGRLLKAYVQGNYRELPIETLLKILASFIYFISPIDLLPDFLPVLGLTDDLALLVWVVNGIDSDLKKFEEWEKTGAVEIK